MPRKISRKSFALRLAVLVLTAIAIAFVPEDLRSLAILLFILELFQLAPALAQLPILRTMARMPGKVYARLFFVLVILAVIGMVYIPSWVMGTLFGIYLLGLTLGMILLLSMVAVAFFVSARVTTFLWEYNKSHAKQKRGGSYLYCSKGDYERDRELTDEVRLLSSRLGIKFDELSLFNISLALLIFLAYYQNQLADLFSPQKTTLGAGPLPLFLLLLLTAIALIICIYYAFSKKSLFDANWLVKGTAIAFGVAISTVFSASVSTAILSNPENSLLFLPFLVISVYALIKSVLVFVMFFIGAMPTETLVKGQNTRIFEIVICSALLVGSFYWLESTGSTPALAAKPYNSLAAILVFSLFVEPFPHIATIGMALGTAQFVEIILASLSFRTLKEKNPDKPAD
ncbi:MAG: hypothetical protein NT067_07385 [Candidatus Diapherotrites archaeon]|nr:hypothetical protein [Candidatus Diapherotrites archaeon]